MAKKGPERTPWRDIMRLAASSDRLQRKTALNEGRLHLMDYLAELGIVVTRGEVAAAIDTAARLGRLSPRQLTHLRWFVQMRNYAHYEASFEPEEVETALQYLHGMLHGWDNRCERHCIDPAIVGDTTTNAPRAEAESAPGAAVGAATSTVDPRRGKSQFHLELERAGEATRSSEDLASPTGLAMTVLLQPTDDDLRPYAEAFVAEKLKKNPAASLTVESLLHSAGYRDVFIMRWTAAEEDRANGVPSGDAANTAKSAPGIPQVDAGAGEGGQRLRVYELAKELGRTGEDLVQVLRAMGFEVKNKFSAVAIDAARLKMELELIARRQESGKLEHVAPFVLRRRIDPSDKGE